MLIADSKEQSAIKKYPSSLEKKKARKLILAITKAFDIHRK
jgi:hypothetical protein